MMPPFVCVLWRDSSMEVYQVAAEDLPSVAVLRTVGWLVKDADDDYIVVARDLTKNEFRGALAIPRENITDLRYLTAKATDE